MGGLTTNRPFVRRVGRAPLQEGLLVPDHDLHDDAPPVPEGGGVGLDLEVQEDERQVLETGEAPRESRGL